MIEIIFRKGAALGSLKGDTLAPSVVEGQRFLKKKREKIQMVSKNPHSIKSLTA